MKSKVSDSPNGCTQTFAELLFDSFRDPSPVGVRSTATNMVRYLLYRSGSYVIEMRLEFAEGSKRYALTGQILNPDEWPEKLDKLPVRLRSGRDELAHAPTNNFGEFNLEYETGKNVQVCIAMAGQNEIVIPLDEAFWRMSALQC
jgi:hypothetical protein